LTSTRIEVSGQLHISTALPLGIKHLVTILMDNRITGVSAELLLDSSLKLYLCGNLLGVGDVN
jgi:hypothetical protein